MPHHLIYRIHAQDNRYNQGILALVDLVAGQELR